MRKSPVGLLAVGIVLAIALLASACGGPATPGVASLTGTSTNANSATHSSGTGASAAGATAGSTKRHDALAFAKCMRRHGVKNFPEHGPVQIAPGTGLDPNSPTFQAAQQACQSLLPKPSAAQLQKIKKNALKFSECMRSHGVTNFPDPTISSTDGGIGIRISAGKGGLDPNSPTFKAAQRSCSKYMRLPNGGPKAVGP